MKCVISQGFVASNQFQLLSLLNQFSQFRILKINPILSLLNWFHHVIIIRWLGREHFRQVVSPAFGSEFFAMDITPTKRVRIVNLSKKYFSNSFSWEIKCLITNQKEFGMISPKRKENCEKKMYGPRTRKFLLRNSKIQTRKSQVQIFREVYWLLV